MALHPSRAGDGLREVGVEAAVVIVQSQLLGRTDVLRGIQHLDIFIGVLHTHIPIIRDMDLRTTTLLGGHLDDTGGPSRTVLRRLGCIL